MSRKELTDEERREIGEKAAVVAQLLVRLGRWYIRAVRAESGQNEPAEQKFAATLAEGVLFVAESGVLNNKY